MFLPLDDYTVAWNHHHWKRHRVQDRTMSPWDVFFSSGLWIGLWDAWSMNQSWKQLVGIEAEGTWVFDHGFCHASWLHQRLDMFREEHVSLCSSMFFQYLNIYIYIYTHMLLYIHSFSQYFILIFQLEVRPHGNLLTRTRKAENIGTGCFLMLYHKWYVLLCCI